MSTRNAFALICLAWVALLFLVDPRGDFALNDDWAFAATTRQFVLAGAYQPHDWTSNPLIAHVMWGAGFCRLFGCGHEVLRASSLVAACLGLLALYLIAKRCGLRKAAVWMSVATLALSPLYLPLAHTYMTDVSFTAALLGSVYFFVSHLRKQRPIDWMLGTAFLLLATLSRQPGLAVAIGYGVARCLPNKATPALGRLRFVQATLPLVMAATCLATYEAWLAASGRAPALYYMKYLDVQRVLSAPLAAVTPALLTLNAIVLTLGLLAMPLILMRCAQARLASRHRGLTDIGAWPWLPALLLTAGAWLHARSFGALPIMPILGNVMDAGGVGPVLLGAFDGRYASPWPLPELLWFAATAIAYFGALSLLWALQKQVIVLWARAAQRRGTGWNFGAYAQVQTLLAVTCVAYVLPLLATRTFDRYLIPVVPLVGLLVSAPRHLARGPYRVRAKPRKSSLMAYGAMVLLAAYSITTAHDYLAWNRARSKAVDVAQRCFGARPEAIDAGFEYNAPQLSNHDLLVTSGSGNWWTKSHVDYVVTGKRIRELHLLASVEWRSWIFFRDEYIYLQTSKNNSIELLMREQPIEACRGGIAAK